MGDPVTVVLHVRLAIKSIFNTLCVKKCQDRRLILGDANINDGRFLTVIVYNFYSGI